MIVPVVIVSLVSLTIFTILFIYLFRIHKQLKIRYLKPVPGPTLPNLDQHQELAFVLEHGVEAYNAQRRQRQLQQREQIRTASAASIQSSHPSISSELPAYSPNPTNGEVGFASRAIDHTDTMTPTTLSDDTPSSASTLHHDNSLPPLYIQQVPSNRVAVQAALLSTDNSPSVPTTTSGNNPTTATRPRQSGRRRSIVSVVLARRDNQRSVSMNSSSSSDSVSLPVPLPESTSPSPSTLPESPTLDLSSIDAGTEMTQQSSLDNSIEARDNLAIT